VEHGLVDVVHLVHLLGVPRRDGGYGVDVPEPGDDGLCGAVKRKVVQLPDVDLGGKLAMERHRVALDDEHVVRGVARVELETLAQWCFLGCTTHVAEVHAVDNGVGSLVRRPAQHAVTAARKFDGLVIGCAFTAPEGLGAYGVAVERHPH
jgi:hypothetical protein